MKRCSKCGQDKPKSEFYRQPNGKDGLRAECKECKDKAHADRYGLKYGDRKNRAKTRVDDTLKSPKRPRLTCPACGTAHKNRPASWVYGNYCSWECYLSMPFPKVAPHIKDKDLERICRQYPSQVAAAAAVGINALYFGRVVKKRGLTHHFADRRSYL